MDNSPGWARIPLRCASYDEPTVIYRLSIGHGLVVLESRFYSLVLFFIYTRLVQLTLILGLIKRSFCDNTDVVILIRWFYHPKFLFLILLVRCRYLLDFLSSVHNLILLFCMLIFVFTIVDFSILRILVNFMLNTVVLYDGRSFLTH
ncbi:hypothetical protein DERF_002670 [Dermatophagoides farinae]|uniref:Uncharacterized protein n=1 Tax=Dermatophagoides farinae TaxID=6954 RepID=A0A922IGL6_DERFA|nr:hypothetical protein DERF_002670 [Dermatophagoides farinae]